MDIVTAEEKRLKEVVEQDRKRRKREKKKSLEKRAELWKGLAWKIPYVWWLVLQQHFSVARSRHLRGPLKPTWDFFFEVRHKSYEAIIKKVNHQRDRLTSTHLKQQSNKFTWEEMRTLTALGAQMGPKNAVLVQSTEIPTVPYRAPLNVDILTWIPPYWMDDVIKGLKKRDRKRREQDKIEGRHRKRKKDLLYVDHRRLKESLAKLPVVLFVHGGGHVLGDKKRNWCKFLSGFSKGLDGLPYLLPHYALAPDHPYPEDLADVTSLYLWLVDPKGGNFSPKEIILGGDSSGGAICLSILLQLKELRAAEEARRLPKGEPIGAQFEYPLCALLISPWINLSNESSVFTRAKDSPLGEAATIMAVRFRRAYLGMEDPLLPQRVTRRQKQIAAERRQNRKTSTSRVVVAKQQQGGGVGGVGGEPPTFPLNSSLSTTSCRLLNNASHELLQSDEHGGGNLWFNPLEGRNEENPIVDPHNPLVSPFYGDPTGFPPLFLSVGSEETLRKDLEDYFIKCTDAGVDVNFVVGREMDHAYQSFWVELDDNKNRPEVARAIRNMGAFVQKMTTKQQT